MSDAMTTDDLLICQEKSKHVIRQQMVRGNCIVVSRFEDRREAENFAISLVHLRPGSRIFTINDKGRRVPSKLS